MELVEPIERINEILSRQYGLHDDGRPRFRVVWSEDQLEKRLTTHTKEGIELMYPEVIERKKYQYIQDRYILEQLSIVPENDPNNDLTEKLSYEPLWTFQDRFENYLPPRIDACIFLINNLYEATERANKGLKNVIKEDPEAAAKELAQIEEYLFGNETPVTDALGLGLGVTDFHPKVDFSNEVKKDGNS